MNAYAPAVDKNVDIPMSDYRNQSLFISHCYKRCISCVQVVVGDVFKQVKEGAHVVCCRAIIYYSVNNFEKLSDVAVLCIGCRRGNNFMRAGSF